MNDNQLIRPVEERYEKLTWENATPAQQDRGREIMREARFAGHPIELNQSVRQAAAEEDHSVRQGILGNAPHIHGHVMIAGATHAPAEIAAHTKAVELVEKTWADLHPRIETEHGNKAVVGHKQEHGFGNSI